MAHQIIQGGSTIAPCKRIEYRCDAYNSAPLYPAPLLHAGLTQRGEYQGERGIRQPHFAYAALEQELPVEVGFVPARITKEDDQFKCHAAESSMLSENWKAVTVGAKLNPPGRHH